MALGGGLSPETSHLELAARIVFDNKVSRCLAEREEQPESLRGSSLEIFRSYQEGLIEAS